MTAVRRHRLTSIRLSEIAGVGSPAQEPAKALIIKRRDGAPRGEPARKSAVRKDDVVDAVTSVTNGHLHGIEIDVYDSRMRIYVGYAKAEGVEYGHDHQLLRAPDGTYSVLPNAGHTHDLDNTAFAAAVVASVNKSNSREGEPMTKDEQAKFDELVAKSERMEKVLALNPDHRAYYDGMESDDNRGKFLAKSADERDAIVEKAKKAAQPDPDLDPDNPVVYKSKSLGIDIRKSDGPAMLAMAKRSDAQADETATLREENAELKKGRDMATFEKRAAEELPHLPGTLKSRASLLKAAEGIEDSEERAQAVAALKSQSDAMKPLFSGIGVTGAGEIFNKSTGEPGADAQEKLDELAKAHQAANAGTTFEQASVAVLKTAEGADLYQKVLAADAVAARDAA